MIYFGKFFIFSFSYIPDWAIYWTLGNFLKPLASINLPKSLTFLGNFCKGVKIYHFYIEIIFRKLLQTFGDFYLVTLCAIVTVPYHSSYLNFSLYFYRKIISELCTRYTLQEDFTVNFSLYLYSVLCTVLLQEYFAVVSQEDFTVLLQEEFTVYLFK